MPDCRRDLRGIALRSGVRTEDQKEKWALHDEDLPTHSHHVYDPQCLLLLRSDHGFHVKLKHLDVGAIPAAAGSFSPRLKALSTFGVPPSFISPGNKQDAPDAAECIGIYVDDGLACGSGRQSPPPSVRCPPSSFTRCLCSRLGWPRACMGTQGTPAMGPSPKVTLPPGL